MSDKEKSVDIFARIAAERPRAQGCLVSPPPPARPENQLPVYAVAPPPAHFASLPRLQSAAELKAEVARLKEQFTPFLRDLAPRLPETRIRQSLSSFAWREETEADRNDFSSVLAGDGDWETLEIPHYGGPLGQATTFYRTQFEVTEEMRRRDRLFICFKGVDYQAQVFMNGRFLGEHEGFFAPFEFDFTAYARAGKNTLLVVVKNDAICMGNDSWGDDGKDFEGDKLYAATGPGYDDPEIGWHHCPPGMGIYQQVQVEARATLFIHDLFIRPLPETEQAEVWIEVWNADRYRHPARVELAVFGQNFSAVALENRAFPLPGELGPRVNYFRFEISLPSPRLWELETPWLYQAQVRLLTPEGVLLDAAAQSFGMRRFTMDTESEPRGRFFLNGREIRLRGANTMGFEQQDVMKQDWEQLIEDILLARACRMNFWRLTQRPVQEEVYEYCDRLGLMTQTDLPLFGKLRRNQFAEAIRQAGEMEKLVRAHPCNILVSYINEPFPSGGNAPMWRHLGRAELERFFLAADQAVLQENPDRVIKAVDGDYDPPGPGLPDNHCYCGWYNGHGVEIGRLHRGYWQPIKPGWMHGCGEFGSEGLEDASLMRRAYPASWLPQNANEERTWSPDRIVKAQTGPFHYMWFDTQYSLDDWVRVSQAHQAWVTRIMTEAFRRDSRMNTFAIHLFIDAFPAGWMKTILDVDRRPKPAYFVYREALTPLMVNLRADRNAWFGGETAEMEAWICNDTHEPHAGAKLAYRLEINGETLTGGQVETELTVCSSACRGLLAFPLPQVSGRTIALVRLALLNAENTVLHDTCLELQLFPRPVQSAALVFVLGAADGKAAGLVRELGLEPEVANDVPESAAVIVIDDWECVIAREAELQAAVEGGACVVILEIPAGDQTLLGETIRVQACGMGPVQFVSRATGHELVREFKPDDFKFWYDAALGHPSPLLERTFIAETWTPILASGNGCWGGEWKPALAAAEKRVGRGAWRICNVKLAGRIQGNPVADAFARNLILMNPSPEGQS